MPRSRLKIQNVNRCQVSGSSISPDKSKDFGENLAKSLGQDLNQGHAISRSN